MKQEILMRFDHPFANCAIMIEDDGDVWLYNRTSAPKTLRWQQTKDGPFLNKAELVSGEAFVLPLSNEEFTVE